jgi:hypothetical protein
MEEKETIDLIQEIEVREELGKLGKMCSCWSYGG